MRDVKRMKSNIIHIRDLFFVDDKEENTILSSYINVAYGCNVKFSTK